MAEGNSLFKLNAGQFLVVAVMVAGGLLGYIVNDAVGDEAEAGDIRLIRTEMTDIREDVLELKTIEHVDTTALSREIKESKTEVIAVVHDVRDELKADINENRIELKDVRVTVSALDSRLSHVEGVLDVPYGGIGR